MRLIFFIICVFYSVCSISQTIIKATVKDSKTKESLDFCNVSVKGTNKGTITNADGVFSISVDLSKDALLFSYLGYETQSIQAATLLQKRVVFLIKEDFTLQEVSVHSDNDYLYDIMVNCREKLIKNKVKKVAKVYYGMETESKTISMEYQTSEGSQIYNKANSQQKEEPVELLECFYNGQFKGTNVEGLYFKNGRTALAAIDNYFLTLNSSKAISKIILSDKNENFPAIPFQFNKSSMKKRFNLEQQYCDGNNYNIKFSTKTNVKDCFSGEVWIEKGTYDILKICLKKEKTITHPFLPIFPSDSISNVSFDITNTYKNDGGIIVPDHIKFNYSFTYTSRRDTQMTAILKNVNREINSKGIMYFYDYDHPFILPYFSYSNDFNDYNKMSFIPYNEKFWNNNATIIQTEKQRENFSILINKGNLINYREGNYGHSFLTMLTHFNQEQLFEFFYAFWSADKRLIPNKTSQQFETFSKEIINKSIKTDLYNLKAQILLDITESSDSLFCKSYTVFDNEQSYFHLPIDSNTNAFINMYFDICEIERRKMQDKLNQNNFIISQIDSIYKGAIENMNNVTKYYLKEVEAGENDKLFHKWNNYVIENLNIDNIKLVDASK